MHKSVPLRLSDHLQRWTKELLSVSESPRLDAEILFKYISGFNDSRLITESNQVPELELLTQLEPLIAARRCGVPVAYLTGKREFYSLPLKVNSHVLIPRPDTECLVEAAIGHINEQSVLSVLDMGTGSGAIALALAHHLPGLEVTATDRDEKALSIARENARQLELHHVRFIRSDWFKGMGATKFDLIVSNPPYIDPSDAHLQQGDVRFEPRSALVAEDHGLADLKEIIIGAPQYLNPGGRLMLEHGFDQAHAVTSLLLENGYQAVETHKDFGQNDRLSSGVRPA